MVTQTYGLMYRKTVGAVLGNTKNGRLKMGFLIGIPPQFMAILIGKLGKNEPMNHWSHWGFPRIHLEVHYRGSLKRRDLK